MHQNDSTINAIVKNTLRIATQQYQQLNTIMRTIFGGWMGVGVLLLEGFLISGGRKMFLDSHIQIYIKVEK